MKLVYDIHEKPPIKNNLVFALQQLLAIMAATLLVPVLADASGLYLDQAAALCGAGFGTLFYVRHPVYAISAEIALSEC